MTAIIFFGRILFKLEGFFLSLFMSQKKKKLIYLDHSATAPIDSVVLKKMLPFFDKKWANPSALYDFGQDVRQAVEVARNDISVFLGCFDKEVIFISGATEGNAWVIKNSNLLFKGPGRPHLVTTSIEHHSIWELCHNLKKKGEVEITFLPVSKDGIVDAKDVSKAIKKNTILVSVMYANNEMGSVQPIKEIGQLIKKVNSSRKNKILFHSDAVQAVNYLDCQVNHLGVDMLTFDAHKIYGPKGAGVLYLRSGIGLEPLIGPGSQEFGLRAGTENVPGIIGLAEAVKRIEIFKKKNKEIAKLRNKLIEGILKTIPRTRVNGSLKNRLPNNANISFSGVEGESILMELAERGICVSTGSACASHSLKASHVLLALGLSHEEAHSSIRFTLGRGTKASEVNYLLKILPDIIGRLRSISGR